MNLLLDCDQHLCLAVASPWLQSCELDLSTVVQYHYMTLFSLLGW